MRPRRELDPGTFFGRLAVIRMGPTRGRSRARAWCLCTCGNRVLVDVCNLRRGVTKSCGCLRAEKGRASWAARIERYRIEPGTRFGRRVVLERAGNDPKGAALYLCRCDCGWTAKMRGSALRLGLAQSCGGNCAKQLAA